MPFKSENVDPNTPLNIRVHCDRGISSEINKIKYDGKPCVRAFIQRVTEFSSSRSISETVIMSHASDIFVGDALQWHRGVRDQVRDWQELQL